MMNSPRKIHIIGSTGSGKTYLAGKLAERLNIPYYELDNVVWSGTSEKAGLKHPPEVRDRLLGDILAQEAWIVEGVYHKWLDTSFRLADIIIFLSPSVASRDRRIVTRFIKQRCGIERSNYKQTVKGLVDMLKWNHKFERVNRPAILEVLQPYQDKLILESSNEKWLKKTLRRTE